MYLLKQKQVITVIKFLIASLNASEVLSYVLISYTHEWNILKSQHFLPLKKEILQCDNASIMASHLRMSFCFSKIFFGSWEIFHTYCNSNKMITHSFFLLRWSMTQAVCHCAELLRGDGCSFPDPSRPWENWQQRGAWLKTACHWFVSNMKVLCAYVFIHLKFCNVFTHTRITMYFYQWISISILFNYLTPQNSSLCSGRCLVNHLSMGWKIK